MPVLLRRWKAIKFLAFVVTMVTLVGLRVQSSRHTNQSSPILFKNSTKNEDLQWTKSKQNNQSGISVASESKIKASSFLPNEFDVKTFEIDRNVRQKRDNLAREKATTNAFKTHVRIEENVMTPSHNTAQFGSEINITRLSSKSIKTERNKTSAEFKTVEYRFEERNRAIRNVCYDERYRNKLTELGSKGRVVHLASHRLSVCLVPKAGTTYILYQLSKSLHLKEDRGNKAHDKKRFFITREPYGRLVSAFFSKVVSHPKWWTSLGRFIIKNFRKNASAKSLYCGYDVTFPEFIKYFIMAQSLNQFKNNHFVPVHEICNPCQDDARPDGAQRFDYNVHLETMKDDMEFILDSVDVTTHDNFRFDPVKNIVGHFMNSRDHRHGHCGGPWCPIFQRLWWALQSNGHISRSIPLPLKGMECDDVTPNEMIDLALKAEAESRSTVDKASQKREALAELYAEVSLTDRLKVKDALEFDFKLFGYDPQPDFVFSPQEIEELKNKES